VGRLRAWGATNIATACLGLALVVFFAGATAAVAAGANPPTALWAAGGALSGGLLGLLSPSPGPAAVRNAAINKKQSLLAEGGDPLPAGQAAALDSAANTISWVTFGALVVVFVVLLTLAVALAGGAITPPPSFGPQSLQDLIKAIIALASAAGTGVLGLLAPTPSGG
jgi:hypothetical protein